MKFHHRYVLLDRPLNIITYICASSSFYHYKKLKETWFLFSVVKQQEKIIALDGKLKNTEQSQADKVEKNLVKSLLIGYIVSSNQNDKNQILKLITTVLDFTPNETDRVGLNKSHTGWLTGLLHGAGGQTGSKLHRKTQQSFIIQMITDLSISLILSYLADHSKDSLVQAFVNFLEKESQPRPSAANMPNLLQITQENKYSSSAATSPGTSTQQSARKLSQQSNSSNPSSSGIQPILLNESVLEQFAPTRNSSSILKDILSDSWLNSIN